MVAPLFDSDFGKNLVRSWEEGDSYLGETPLRMKFTEFGSNGYEWAFVDVGMRYLYRAAVSVFCGG